MPENPQVTNVSDLLLPSGGWNEDLIKQVFFNVDAQAILCTPTRGHGNDAWAWEPERHGLYTIGSAYRKLYEDNNQPVNDGGASRENVETDLGYVCSTKSTCLLVAGCQWLPSNKRSFAQKAH